MTVRDMHSSVTQCVLNATALASSGAAAGYLAAFLAPLGSEGMGLVAGGLVAFAALASFAAIAPSLRRTKAHGDAPSREAPDSRPAQAPEPVRRAQIGDIPVPLDGPTIDESTFEGLQRLGGAAFVEEVIAQFISEGVLTLLKVAQAIGEGDAADYASQIHALRSSAANVGARRLYRLCLEWRELTVEELAATGSARFVLLQKEFLAAERTLKARRPHADREVTDAAQAG